MMTRLKCLAWKTSKPKREARQAFSSGGRFHAYPYLAVVNDYASGRWSTRLLRAQKAGARIIIRVAPNDEMVDLIAGEQRLTQRCLLAEAVGQVRHWLI